MTLSMDLLPKPLTTAQRAEKYLQQTEQVQSEFSGKKRIFTHLNYLSQKTSIVPKIWLTTFTGVGTALGYGLSIIASMNRREIIKPAIYTFPFITAAIYIHGYIWQTEKYDKNFEIFHSKKMKNEINNSIIEQAYNVHENDNVLSNFLCTIEEELLKDPILSPTKSLYNKKAIFKQKYGLFMIKDPKRNPSFSTSQLLECPEVGLVVNLRLLVLLKSDLANLPQGVKSIEEQIVEKHLNESIEFITENYVFFYAKALTAALKRGEEQTFKNLFGDLGTDLDWTQDWRSIVETRYKRI